MKIESKKNEMKSVNSDSGYLEEKPFNTCETCTRGIVTKNGVICGDSLALVCKPYLLEEPKHYKNWESD